MRVALGLEYCGRPYEGWQKQPHGRTVQDVLALALSAIAGHSVRTIAAGRTDTGVHATQQVVHFDTLSERPLTAWVRGVNSLLPQNIAVKWARIVPLDFHARFSARARHYCYYLLLHPVRPAVLSGLVGWYFRPVELDQMQQAAQLLLGTHDFSSFRAAGCQAKTPVKTLHQLDITPRGNMLRFDLCADAFLQHMVRNIVGALVYVGKGSTDLNDFASLLAACNRDLAPPTFMADGLYLTGVDYPESFQLPNERDDPLFF